MYAIQNNDAAAVSIVPWAGRPGACPSVDARGIVGTPGMAMGEPRGWQTTRTSPHSNGGAKQLRGLASVFDIGGGLHSLVEGDGRR